MRLEEFGKVVGSLEALYKLYPALCLSNGFELVTLFQIKKKSINIYKEFMYIFLLSKVLNDYDSKFDNSLLKILHLLNYIETPQCTESKLFSML